MINQKYKIINRLSTPSLFPGIIIFTEIYKIFFQIFSQTLIKEIFFHYFISPEVNQISTFVNPQSHKSHCMSVLIEK